MALKPLDKLHAETFNLFKEYYEEELHPNLRLVANRIGISYQTLKNFNSGMQTSYKNLYLINSFLEEKGYKLKEHA